MQKFVYLENTIRASLGENTCGCCFALNWMGGGCNHEPVVHEILRQCLTEEQKRIFQTNMILRYQGFRLVCLKGCLPMEAFFEELCLVVGLEDVVTSLKCEEGSL